VIVQGQKDRGEGHNVSYKRHNFETNGHINFKFGGNNRGGDVPHVTPFSGSLDQVNRK